MEFANPRWEGDSSYSVAWKETENTGSQRMMALALRLTPCTSICLPPESPQSAIVRFTGDKPSEHEHDGRDAPHSDRSA